MAQSDPIDVTAGQAVTGGQQVGTVGNTGNARGGDAHVHAQWYPGGQSDPAPAGSTLGAACGHDPDNLAP